MGIDVFGLVDSRCHESGNHRVILCDLGQSFGWAIEVEPAIADMRHVGGRINHQGRSHRRSHFGSLLLVALVHHPIGILDAFDEQGEQCL